MARKIASRLRITGKLVACGPLHVGGAGGNADVDLALAENGQGKLYVPGTSLAGPLRAWLRQRVGDQEVNKVWGYQEQRPTEREPQGHASFVIVEDGLVKLPAGATVETRDGVGIDRVMGAAAEHVKYNRAVLPSGSEIELEITVELKEKNDAARSHLIAALQALQRGEIRFGAAKTRGLGQVTLKDLSVCEQDLLSFRGMLQTLRNKKDALDLKNLSVQILPGVPTLSIQIDWSPRGPLMVKAERDGVAVDMLPLVSAKGGDLTFVLPGSSIKGALRSQAERIVRTVHRVPAPQVVDSRKAFLKQIEVMEREDKDDEEGDRSLIGALFGAAGKANKKDIKDEGPPLLGLSALTVEDCYAQPRFTPRHWDAIEAAADSDTTQALQLAGLTQMQQAFHVAIDRWTGGAADGFLYTVLEPHGVAWEPMRLTLDLSRLRKDDRPAAVMCLLLTLRDLVNGRIPLGFATNRGMGAIEVAGIEITTVNLEDELSDLNAVKIIDGKLGGWSERLKTSLESEWAKNGGGEAQ
ncbi:MAG: RAMP superfamily CRISPR-associated protein [Acidobacteriota bacterium]